MCVTYNYISTYFLDGLSILIFDYDTKMAPALYRYQLILYSYGSWRLN